MCSSKLNVDKNKVNNIRLIPTKNPNRFKVVLHLETMKDRPLGMIETSGSGYFVSSRKPEHIYKKFNFFGLNYDLIHNQNIEFKWIIIRCEDKEYITTREYVKKKGKPTSYRKKGFELQLHIPLDEMNMETVREFEKSKPFQFRMFDDDDLNGGDYANA